MDNTEQLTRENDKPYFRKMGLVKLFFMCIFNLELLWIYAQWSSYAKKTGKKLFPFWLSVLQLISLLFLFSTLSRQKNKPFIAIVGLIAVVFHSISNIFWKISREPRLEHIFNINGCLETPLMQCLSHFQYPLFFIFIAGMLYFQFIVNKDIQEIPSECKQKDLSFLYDKEAKYGWGYYLILVYSVYIGLATIGVYCIIFLETLTKLLNLVIQLLT